MRCSTLVGGMLTIFLTSAAMGAVTGQLRLEPISSGSYTGTMQNAWLSESFFTTKESFDLSITNHNDGDIYHLFLLVAVDRNPSDIVRITVSGSPVTSYNGIITNNNSALVDEVVVKKGNKWVPYEYPGHGIYTSGSNTRFEVLEVPIRDDNNGNGILETGETASVPVEINPLNSEVRVHFDAVGSNDVYHSGYEAVAFAPPSKDVTFQIPEFPTVGLPVAIAIGVLFMFRYRNNKEG